MTNVICTQRRGKVLVVWHDGHEGDPRMVSPVELQLPRLNSPWRAKFDAALSEALVEPMPDAKDMRIAELGAENKGLKAELSLGRAG